MINIKVLNQGQALIRQSSARPGLWLMSTPDGDVNSYPSREAALKSARAWFRKHAAKKGSVMSVGAIRE